MNNNYEFEIVSCPYSKIILYHYRNFTDFKHTSFAVKVFGNFLHEAFSPLLFLFLVLLHLVLG